MKSPAFQFYAADYLADEAVTLMSLEAEGAYIRLIAYCWREGSIPANVKQLSRLCKGATPEIIEEVLTCFYPDPSQEGRLLNKRLEAEREKQEQHRLKQSENGKRGGRPAKPVGNPDETQNKAVGLFGLSQTEAKKSSSITSATSTTSSLSDNNNVNPISSGVAPQEGGTKADKIINGIKEEIKKPVPPAKGSDLTEKEARFLALFNETCKRKFETLPDKVKKQFIKLRKKGFVYEDFKKSIENGYQDSLRWDDPGKYTPEYATREVQFENYLYAQTKKTATGPTPKSLADRLAEQAKKTYA